MVRVPHIFSIRPGVTFFISLFAFVLASGSPFEASPARLTKQLAPGQKAADVQFVFRNISDRHQKVSTISASCGCTVATSDKADYGPGEVGVLNIVVDAKNQVRDFSVSINMYGAEDQQVLLSCIADFKFPSNLISADGPRFLLWKRGEKPTTKRVGFVLQRGLAVQWPEVVSNDRFTVQRVFDDAVPDKFWIEITPIHTRETGGIVIIQRDKEDILRPYVDRMRVFGYIQ